MKLGDDVLILEDEDVDISKCDEAVNYRYFGILFLICLLLGLFDTPGELVP